MLHPLSLASSISDSPPPENPTPTLPSSVPGRKQLKTPPTVPSGFLKMLPAEVDLWKRYLPDRSDREVEGRLFELHMAFALRYAYNARKRYFGMLDREELKSAALLGLLSAIRRYDPARGAFLMYAAIKIRFEFINFLMELFGANAKQVWQYRRCVQKLRQYGFVNPPVELVAAELNISIQYCRQLEASSQKAISLEAIGRGDGEDEEAAFEPPDTSMDSDPSYRLEMSDLREYLTSKLGEREQKIIRLWLDAGLTQREIADRLGLCPGRISQILRVIFNVFRKRMNSLTR